MHPTSPHYHSIADIKRVGILVALEATHLKKFGLEVKKKANIASMCRECQTLSCDIPIIILPSIIREE